jgi:hypothetical protein
MRFALMADLVETVVPTVAGLAIEVVIGVLLRGGLMQTGIASLGQACRGRWHWQRDSRLQHGLAFAGGRCGRLPGLPYDRLAQPACLRRHRRSDCIFRQPGFDMRGR